MKLSVRLAGIFGTGVFLVTSLPGFYKQIQPHDFAQLVTDTFSGISLLETLLLSLSGAIGAGFIGYIMGDILSHPNGKRKKKPALKPRETAEVKEFVPTYSQSPPISSDASLLAVPDPLSEVTEPPLTPPPVPAPSQEN